MKIRQKGFYFVLFVLFVFFVVDLTPQNPGLRNVKNGFLPFSVGTFCHSICSNQNQALGFFGFFEKFSGVWGGYPPKGSAGENNDHG
jgi:hypothetical protein